MGEHDGSYANDSNSVDIESPPKKLKVEEITLHSFVSVEKLLINEHRGVDLTQAFLDFNNAIRTNGFTYKDDLTNKPREGFPSAISLLTDCLNKYFEDNQIQLRVLVQKIHPRFIDNINALYRLEYLQGLQWIRDHNEFTLVDGRKVQIGALLNAIDPNNNLIFMYRGKRTIQHKKEFWRRFYDLLGIKTNLNTRTRKEIANKLDFIQMRSKELKSRR